MKKITEEQLYKAHEKVVTRHNATFLNFEWSTGDDFIHSKTTKGRLLSEIVGNNIKHYWTPGGERGFSVDILEPVEIKIGNNRRRRIK